MIRIIYSKVIEYFRSTNCSSTSWPVIDTSILSFVFCAVSNVKLGIRISSGKY